MVEKNKASIAQITLIHTKIKQLGLSDNKEWMVSLHTNHRTTSVGEMKWYEAKELISSLLSQDNQSNSVNKMQRKIFSMAHEMHWQIEGQPGGKKKVDMERLNNWCIKSSYLKKKLDDYTYSELPKLVSQFEAVYKDFLKKV